MSVSVIIPTFNVASRIGNCLGALPELVGTDAAIIVVNDGSTDNTIEAVRAYPPVRLLTQVNAGPAAAQFGGGGSSGRNHSLHRR